MVFISDDRCYCLLRQDGQPNSGYLGTSRPPYIEWNWKKLGELKREVRDVVAVHKNVIIKRWHAKAKAQGTVQ